MSRVEAPSEPWWPKPIQARNVKEVSWASSERVLFRGLKFASSPESDFKLGGFTPAAARLNGAGGSRWICNPVLNSSSLTAVVVFDTDCR
jgi:hypothetical protein